jgi:hypothetical protein
MSIQFAWLVRLKQSIRSAKLKPITTGRQERGAGNSEPEIDNHIVHTQNGSIRSYTLFLFFF